MNWILQLYTAALLVWTGAIGWDLWKMWRASRRNRRRNSWRRWLPLSRAWRRVK